MWSVNNHGFLPNEDPLERLSSPIFLEHEKFLDKLPFHISGGQVQDLVKGLPMINAKTLDENLPNEREVERAVLVFSYISHSFLNGECGGKADLQTGTSSLPANLAIPWTYLCEKVSRPPILTYASCVLYNWSRFDRMKPISLDNITIMSRFLGVVDEEWFFKIHVVIEAQAAEAVRGTRKIVQFVSVFLENTEKEKTEAINAITEFTCRKVIKSMRKIRDALDNMNDVLAQLIRRCDPHIFFGSLRLFLGSFSDGKGRSNGLIFEGVPKYNNSPQKFIGASGAQSSILPVLDALLGIVVQNHSLKNILDGVLNYMPKEHRIFLQSIPIGILRKFIDKHQHVPDLCRVYDSIIDKIVLFRKSHLSYAAQYIVREVEKRKGEMVLGTGGTPFMEYLLEHLKTTKRSQYGFTYTKAGYIRGTMRNLVAHLPDTLKGHNARIVDVEPQIRRKRCEKFIFLIYFVLMAIFIVIIGVWIIFFKNANKI